MAIIGLENVTREIWDDASDAGGPAYERIDATAHYAVDPLQRGNHDITDLELAPRDDGGLVHFLGDLTVLRPSDAAASNGICLLEVPNRGRRVATTLFNRAEGAVPPTRRIPAGDGWLFRRGYTVAWAGWQWDVPREPGRMGLEAPSASAALPDGVEIQLRIQLGANAARVSLTDQHVGQIGGHTPIPTADVADPMARMLVRDRLHEPPSELPRDGWSFPDDTSVAVDGGFRAGRIYDLVYRALDVPVVGAGLLAVRDAAAFLGAGRAGDPLHGGERIIAVGLSQNSRFLRHLLSLGLDRDEEGRRVLDGVIGLVGGARRGQFNHRGAQPSVQPTLDFGHLFPFADLPQTDPHSGTTAGLLDRVGAQPDPPKIVFCDTGAEYWRGDAALAHTSVEAGPARDVPDAAFVRRYLFSGTQHGPGDPSLEDATLFGSRGAHPLNIVDYRPLYRAALTNLVAWIEDGTPPPPSEVPRLADGTAIRRRAAIERLAALGPIVVPDADELAVMTPIDLGPRASEGIGRYPAEVTGPPHPDWVSALDADGNEVAGIAMPDVAVPVATHAGFNPRHPETGAPGQIIEYSGSSIPFARTEAERAANDDRRSSIEARYEGRGDYLRQIQAAAQELVAKRHLLAEDVDVCVEIAAERWDLIVTEAG